MTNFYLLTFRNKSKKRILKLINEERMASSSEAELTEKVSNLLIELQVAKESIADLQSKLESRESELRVAKEKQEQNFRRKSRRRRISGVLNADFISMNNLNQGKL